MVRPRKDAEPVSPRRPPATTPEGRENQLVSLAVDLAERQLNEGTASSQVITHYLKLGTTREKLEKEKLINETKLLQAKVDDIQSNAQTAEMIDNAVKAMSTYQGRAVEDDGYEN